MLLVFEPLIRLLGILVWLVRGFLLVIQNYVQFFELADQKKNVVKELYRKTDYKC